MNFVAVLAVLAASSFALPLLVQGGEALGLGRGASVVGSLVIAALAAVVFVTRAWLAGRRRASTAAPERRAQRARQTASGTVPRAPAAGLVDAAGLRLLDPEEDTRARL